MKKFTTYPVNTSEGAEFGIVLYVSGQKRGYLSSSAQSRGTFMLRISTNIDHAKSYTTLAGAKRAFAQYKYANEIAVYHNTSMPVEKWLMYIKEDKPEYDWYKWDSRVELKVEPLQESVSSSYTLNSIEEARSRKIPSHAIMMMHTDITTLLENEYLGRDFEVMVQPNNDEYRPAIVIAIESWEEYPDVRLTYKVYLDDPTVIYYGEDYTDESDFGVNSDLSEKIRAIIEKYLRPFMKYEEIRSAASVPCYELDDRGFAQLYGDKHKDAYAGVRIPNEKYSKLPDEIKDLLGEYGLPRAEDNYFHTFVDVGERFDFVTPEHAEFLAEYGICKNSKQFENVWMWDNW